MVDMDQVTKVPCTFLDPPACGGGQAADRLRAQLVHGGPQDWHADHTPRPGIHYTTYYISIHTIHTYSRTRMIVSLPGCPPERLAWLLMTPWSRKLTMAACSYRSDSQ